MKKTSMIPTGCVEVTSGGNLQCKHLIHAVGPNRNCSSQSGLDYQRLLEYTLLNILDRAEQLRCQSISIPAIATGRFGFSKYECARIMHQCVIDYILEKMINGDDVNLKFIRFVNNDEAITESFVR